MILKNQPRLVVLTACALSVLALSGCDKFQQQTAQAPQQVKRPPMPVEVVEVAKTSAAIRTELVGRTSAYQVAEVRPQVSGILQKRLFEEGQEVKAGQPLYQIDPALYEASVKQAEAALAQARAALELRAANARRSAELTKVNAVSAQANDAAQMEWKAAQANVLAAQAALDTARINLRYTSVNSPITGRAAISEVTPGALLTANQGVRLTVIQQLDPIYVDVTQSFDDMQKLRRANLRNDDAQTRAVKLFFADGTEYPYEGVLAFKDMTVNEATNTVRVRALFPNPNRELFPGLYVRARLTDGVKDDVFRLDQRAVMREPTGEAFCYVVQDGKIAKRIVQVSGTDGAFWIVEKGLNPGDKVVVEGHLKVRPGAPVTPIPATKQPVRTMEQMKTGRSATGEH